MGEIQIEGTIKDQTYHLIIVPSSQVKQVLANLEVLRYCLLIGCALKAGRSQITPHFDDDVRGCCLRRLSSVTCYCLELRYNDNGVR